MAAQQQQQSILAAIIARFMAHAVNTFNCRGGPGARVNPDTIECVWTCESDLNAVHVNGEIFESGKENLRIQKYRICVEGALDSLEKALPMLIPFAFEPITPFIIFTNNYRHFHQKNQLMAKLWLLAT